MFSSVVFHGSRLLVWHWIRSREVNPGHDWEWTAPSLVDVIPFFKQGYSIQFQTGSRTSATLIVPHLTWPEHTVHSVITRCVEEKERLCGTLRHTFKAGQRRARFHCEFVLGQRRLRRRITAFAHRSSLTRLHGSVRNIQDVCELLTFRRESGGSRSPRPAAPSLALKGAVLPGQNMGFFIRVTCSVYDYDSYGEESAEYFLLFLLPGHIFQSAGLFFPPLV